MTTRVIKNIEICILDLIIDLLSNRLNPKEISREFVQVLKQKPLFITSIILGSTFVGMTAGYFCYIATSLVR